MTRGNVISLSPAVLLLRVLNAAGVPIVQADIASIVVNVFDTESTLKTVGPLTPSVGSVVFNTLQTDGRWLQDSTGYNVAIAIPGAAWPVAGRYQVQALFTPVSGEAFYVNGQIHADPLFS